MVALPCGDPRTATFTTSVGLITTTGPHGDNVMSSEWTHQLSYDPALIAVCIGPKKATAENIVATKEFGVSIAAVDQNVLASVAGNNSGKKVDKIAILTELGFSFFKAKQIKALMVVGAAMHAECKVIDQKVFGDHVMFVGEVVELYPATDKLPLVYNNTKFSAPGTKLQKPGPVELARIAQIIEKHKK